MLIADAPYRVIGVLQEKGADAGGMPQDDKVLVPVTTAMRRLLNVDYVDRIFVQAQSREQVGKVTRDVRDLLRRRHALDIANQPDDFTIRDQAELVRTVRRSDDTMQSFLGGLSALLLGLACVGLLAVSLLSVRERHAEIGLRLAVGALPRSSDDCGAGRTERIVRRRYWHYSRPMVDGLANADHGNEHTIFNVDSVGASAGKRRLSGASCCTARSDAGIARLTW